MLNVMGYVMLNVIRMIWFHQHNGVSLVVILQTHGITTFWGKSPWLYWWEIMGWLQTWGWYLNIWSVSWQKRTCKGEHTGKHHSYINSWRVRISEKKQVTTWIKQRHGFIDIFCWNQPIEHWVLQVLGFLVVAMGFFLHMVFLLQRWY